MRKKFLAFILISALLIAATGCGKSEPAIKHEDLGFKIGIVTGTVSQGEEEFRAAENMVKKYGENNIVHITYPDKFDQEQETTISQIASLATDEDMKAIVICQAVTGTAAAIDKVKESRDDILFILGAPHEDPDTIASRADILLEPDQLRRGESIVELAKEMGAETFVHYSFPRHMSMELLSQRRDIMKDTAKRVGLDFVELDAPDPLGESGIPGAQQFILEDVPRQVDKYGKNTAFFSTNCGMQEPLIKSALDTGAIFPEQCCPSPYHAYPGALGLEIPEDKAGDLEYMTNQIKEKVAEKDGTGRFGTWIYPANMTMIEAGTEYAMAYAKGETDKFNQDVVLEKLKGIVGNSVEVRPIDDSKPNFLLIFMESQVF